MTWQMESGWNFSLWHCAAAQIHQTLGFQVRGTSPVCDQDAGPGKEDGSLRRPIPWCVRAGGHCELHQEGLGQDAFLLKI